MGDKGIDGLEVNEFDGKFAGSFDMDTQIGKGVSMDDEVSFIVSAHVSAVAHSQTRNGDIKRTNTFKVISAHPIQQLKAEKILGGISQFSHDEIPAADDILDDGKPAWSTAPTADLFDVDEETGEITSIDEEDEDEVVFSPAIMGDDREVFGKPLRYADPVVRKMLGEV